MAAHKIRKLIPSLIVPLFFGLSGLFQALYSPRFGSYRTIDLMFLLASGGCLGVALMNFFIWLAQRSRTS